MIDELALYVEYHEACSANAQAYIKSKEFIKELEEAWNLLAD